MSQIELKSYLKTLAKPAAAAAKDSQDATQCRKGGAALCKEIAILKATEPPKDFTVDTIKSWLESIKAAPDREAVRLLIERIDTKEGEEKEKTAFEMQSTLKAVLSKHGCGGPQHVLPKILFEFSVQSRRRTG
ncbi:hypothetical protein H8S23_13605 [Anaerofilum sp. BX8]|uniref:Uncharacterized protein n=1 Tax=Anaerofilum hominis TaxID=2763016 RepID=A0A923RHJ0_9FIRM|nr:hypothetical protein [Anaerofilum hominis]MBC5582543.1 hypothetical protein [Anaerofilum hominis]